MALSTNITLTVSDYDIKLSRNLKFYENDQLKLIFTLNYWGIDNANGVTQKVLMPLNALSAILFIETPLGVDSIESATIENNVVTFYLTSNQTQHIGVSRMQMQLSDEDGCQITLPPMEFEVRENIYDDEVILSQVLLADENENVVVDENGNAINTGTQVSAQTYAVALSAEDGTTTTTSQPTKQIKDFNLKTDVNGEENLLIQDSDGVTKRIKASEFLNVDIDLTLYYTKEEINTLLDNKANLSHTHNVADIIDLRLPTVDVDKAYVDAQLLTKANITDIPTKVSELTNDSGYLTSIPEEYVTDTELESKGYLTEHQDISNLATKAEVQTKADVNHIHSQYLTTIPTEYITESELADALSTKANTSDIPSLEGYATETYVTNKIAEASLSGGEVDLSNYVTKDELAAKADISSVPTKTSQLTNDSGFITSVPSEYITESELDAKGYLTEHQDITGKADKIYVDTELAKKANISHTHSYNDLTDKPTIPSVDNLATKEELTNGLATKADVSHTHDEYLTSQDLSDYALKTEIPNVPTKTSQLTNDSGYLTSIPSEYVTETELNTGLSSYQTKTDNTLTTTSKTVVGAINELNQIKIVALTQSEYDGLSTKDSNTVYLITD